LAEELGPKLSHSFLNENKARVNWLFLAISDVYPLPDVAQGDEVLAITHEAGDCGDFKKKIQLKSKASATFFLLNPEIQSEKSF
jgi:hypothetical protein